MKGMGTGCSWKLLGYGGKIVGNSFMFAVLEFGILIYAKTIKI